MVYYQALKGANDPRAKDNLNFAYLCELAHPYTKTSEQILENYMYESSTRQNSTEQMYTKRFVDEIYKPIEKVQTQFRKQNTGIYDGNEQLQMLYSAKYLSLYKNALIHAKKIGLPKVYQDYLNYYIYLYDRNK